MNIKCVENTTRFVKIVEVCNYFGHAYTGYQRGGALIPGHPELLLWFPKVNTEGPWVNILSLDGNTLTEAPSNVIDVKKHFDDIYFKKIKMSQHLRVVFAKQNHNIQEYTFIGVYKLDLEISNYNQGLVWVRSKKELDLSVTIR